MAVLDTITRVVKGIGKVLAAFLHACTWLLALVYPHLFFVLGLLFIGAAVATKQIRHIFVPLPPLADAPVFWGYLVFVAVCFFAMYAFALPKRDEQRQGAHPIAANPSKWDLLSWIAVTLRPRHSGYLGLSLLVVAIAWYLVPSPNGHGFWEHASRSALCAFLASTGIWLIAVPRAREHDAAAAGAERVLKFKHAVVSRVLLLSMVSYVVGEIIWFVSTRETTLASPRAYSVWAVTQIFAITLVLAKALDALRPPVVQLNLRVAVLLVLAATVVVFPHQAVGRADAARRESLLAKPVDTTWLRAFRDRLEAVPAPVVIVAASGGGSRAALFTALTLEALGQIRDGDGPQSKTMADHIALISSVSGGSLASAYYVSKRREMGELRSELLNSYRRELIDRMLESANVFYRQVAREARPSPPTSAAAPDSGSKATPELDDVPIFKDILCELEAVSHAGPAPVFDETSSATSPDLHLALRSKFADEMCTDFMAPMLRGALLPMLERGTSLVQFWERRFAWRELENDSALDRDAPLLVLNATDVERGTRLAIGFPSLPRGLLGDTMVSLMDIHPGYRLNLAEAVRLSANFPWGMQVCTLAGDKSFTRGRIPIPSKGMPGTAHPVRLGKRDEVEVLDGGIVDNSGLDTVARLVSRIALLAQGRVRGAPWQWFTGGEPREDPVREVYRLAREIMDLLREKQLLLIEIDSGAKFRSESWMSSLVPTVFRPVDALQTSLHVNALLARDANVEQVRQAMRLGVIERLLVRRHGRAIRVTFRCNSREDVMTSWSLGASDKAKILVQFLAEVRKRQTDIRSFLDMLRAGRGRDIEDAEERLRRESILQHRLYSMDPPGPVREAPANRIVDGLLPKLGDVEDPADELEELMRKFRQARESTSRRSQSLPRRGSRVREFDWKQAREATGRRAKVPAPERKDDRR